VNGEATLAAAAEAARAALGPRNLVLVGFMGTGKSTLGRAAAQLLGRPLVDTDAAVEARAGASVPEIFASRGEAAFRELEAAVVAEVARRSGQVVATGGGVLGRPENVAALRSGGLLVALTARPEVILRRVGGAAAAARRPLLAGPDPLGRVRELLRARAAQYAQADLQLDTSDLDVDQALLALFRLCAQTPEPPVGR
jgi:shikimate kinase